MASDLKRVDALRDQDIDYADIPELDDDFVREARVVVPPCKTHRDETSPSRRRNRPSSPSSPR